MKAIQTNTYIFNQAKKKLEMYMETGKALNCKNWNDLHAYKQGDSISFYNECDLIFEFSRGSYDDNLTNAVIWLFDGAKDPLRKY